MTPDSPIAPVPGLLTTRSWFEPAVVVQALGVGPSSQVFSACGSGELAFALAAEGASVLAVDLRHAQVAYARLALAAVAVLPVQSVRSLFGYGHFGRRVWFYHFLRPHLDSATRAFWDQHEGAIRGGLVNQGHVERRISVLRSRVLGLAVRRDVVVALANAGSLEEQREIFEQRWSGWRWSAALKLVLSPLALTGMGLRRTASPESSYAGRVHARVLRTFSTTWIAAHANLRWALTGESGDSDLAPLWLRPEGGASLRAASPRLSFHHGRLSDALLEPPAGGWSAFYLGDTLDDLSENAQTELLERVVSAAAPGARVVSWRLMRPYVRAAHLLPKLVRDEAASALALAGESVPAWSGVDVETIG